MPNGFEKHAQTAIQVILVAVTLWVGSSVLDVRDRIIRLEEKSTQVREGTARLEGEINSLRTLQSALIERNTSLSSQIRDSEYRIQMLERQAKVRPRE